MKILGRIAWCLCLLGCTNSISEPVHIRMRTDYGEMVFRLSSGTPLHRDNFLHQLEKGTWEGAVFNRVVKDFVVQGGCEDLPDGRIEAASWIPGEFSDSLTHRFGALGMGRDANAAKQSADCQFYIVTHPEGLSRLNGDYTIFGQLIKGEEVLRQLNHAQPNTEEAAPAIPVFIEPISY